MARRKKADWLSVIETARAIGITREAVYKAIEQGRLKARLKVVSRKVWRIDPQSVARFTVSVSHQKRGKRPPLSRLAPKP